MRALSRGTWFPYVVLLSQIPAIAFELDGSVATRKQEIPQVRVHLKATLGKVEDPTSVRTPMEAYVVEIPWGGWVVAEGGHDVIEYGPDGEFRRTLGNRGEGPGELRSPHAVVVDPTDSTWVSDSRGRVVVFGPDGVPARTIQSSAIYQIEAFTESGLPCAFLTKGEMTPSGEVVPWRYIQVWDREGEPLFQLGPGNFATDGQGFVGNEIPGIRGVLVGDTMGVVPSPWEGWVASWTASSERVSVSAESVWSALGLEGVPQSQSDGWPVAVSSDGAGGYWVIGVVRRLSESEEAALIREKYGLEGETSALSKQNSPPILNAVYDGAIIRVTSGGRITAGTIFDEYPWGFSSPSQFYTFSETGSGLIRIKIWETGQGSLGTALVHGSGLGPMIG